LLVVEGFLIMVFVQAFESAIVIGCTRVLTFGRGSDAG